MPVGTRIRKQRWQLDYEPDGKRVAFQKEFLYAPVLACALGTVVWGVLILRSEPR